MALKGLDEKAIIVTGGASGIGLATVRRLRAEGASVLVIDVDEATLAAAAEQLDDDAIVFCRGDVAVEADIDRAFAEATARFGRVDAIFNNAAIVAPSVALHEIDVEQLDRLHRVNVRGPFLGTTRLINHARGRGAPGVVLNVGSSLALVGSPGHGVYSASKAAVLSITRTAAREAAAFGIRVNAVLPGPIATDLLMSMPPDLLAVASAKNPMGRFGQPAELAAVAAWLLSDESSYVNGGIYLCDGGESA